MIVLTLLACMVSYGMSQDDLQDNPVETMNKAISLFEEKWEHSDAVNWGAIRETYLERAQELESIEETYPLIRDLIVNHIDSWSYLEIEAEKAEKPSDQTGFRVLLPDWVVVYVLKIPPQNKRAFAWGIKSRV